MANHGNLVGLRGFFDQRRGAAAIGTLQIFKHHDGDLRPFRWLEDWVDFILSGNVSREQKDYRRKYEVNFIHRCAECNACVLW